MSSTNNGDMIVIRTDTIIYDYDTDFVEPDTHIYLVHKGNYNSCLKYCNNAFNKLSKSVRRDDVLNSINRSGICKLSFFGDEQCSMIVTTEWKIVSSDVYNETSIYQIADKCTFVLSNENLILHIFRSQEEAEEFLETTNGGYRVVPLICHLDWWYAYDSPIQFWYDKEKGGIGVTKGRNIPSDSLIYVAHYHL